MPSRMIPPVLLDFVGTYFPEIPQDRHKGLRVRHGNCWNHFPIPNIAVPLARFLSGNVVGTRSSEVLHEYSVESRPWSPALRSEMDARRTAYPRICRGNPRTYSETRLPTIAARGTADRGGRRRARVARAGHEARSCAGAL